MLAARALMASIDRSSALHSARPRLIVFERALNWFCATLLVGQSIASAQTLLPPPAPLESTVLSSDEFTSTNPHSGMFLGNRSCTSTSCHGNPRRESTIASASQYFFDRDQHQFAGTVLHDQRSEKIAERLKLDKKPSQARECLACHAPAANFAIDHNEFQTLLADGVGCESCHGASRQWLASHHAYEWKYGGIWSPAAKEQIGFRVTKDLVTRAHVCADCHVGNEEQAVTHDMIAAGHPRLTFEFASYQAKMPAHWRRSDDRVRSQPSNGLVTSDRSVLEARNWLIGQFVSAEHELRILSSTVNRPSRTSPELAQYDCFGCHHNLSSPSWRQARASWGLRLGEIQWGTWNLGLVSELQRTMPNIASNQLIEHQNQLRRSLRTLTATRPELVPLIESLRRELAHSAVVVLTVELTPQSLTVIKNSMLDDYDRLTNQGWDRSAQLYLAAIALEKSASDADGRGDRVDPDRQKKFLQLRGHLSYGGAPMATPSDDHPESPYRLETNWPVIRQNFEILRSARNITGAKASVEQSARRRDSILGD